MAGANDLIKILKKKNDDKKSALLARFFKTGKGEYGEGDRFLGVMVPELRRTAKEFLHLDFSRIGRLLKNEYHEVRFTALLILLYKFKRAKEEERRKIFNFYLKNTKYINNWDLVDVTCRDIVGGYLFDKDRRVLYRLARSKNIWERRIAVISTFYFLGQKDCADTLKISRMLLEDKHDLIHKAVGWALRETGKRCGEDKLEDFLQKYQKNMPRTMLRYALEKMSDKRRRFYMKK